MEEMLYFFGGAISLIEREWLTAEKRNLKQTNKQ